MMGSKFLVVPLSKMEKKNKEGQMMLDGSDTWRISSAKNYAYATFHADGKSGGVSRSADICGATQHSPEQLNQPGT